MLVSDGAELIVLPFIRQQCFLGMYIRVSTIAHAILFNINLINAE